MHAENAHFCQSGSTNHTDRHIDADTTMAMNTFTAVAHFAVRSVYHLLIMCYENKNYSQVQQTAGLSYFETVRDDGSPFAFLYTFAIERLIRLCICFSNKYIHTYMELTQIQLL